MMMISDQFCHKPSIKPRPLSNVITLITQKQPYFTYWRQPCYETEFCL